MRSSFRTGSLIALLGSAAAALATYAVAAPGDEDFTEVCVGKDSVLRLATGACPAGDRRLRLSLWESEVISGTESEPQSRPRSPASPPNDSKSDRNTPTPTPTPTVTLPPAPPAKSPAPRPKAPVTNTAQTPSRVAAPFEVVDSTGRTILLVTEGGDGDGRTRGAYIYTSSELPVINLTTPGNTGGLVRVSEAENLETRVSIGALSGSLGLLVSREDQKQAYVGRNEYGGVVQTFTSGEEPRSAMMTEPDGRGSIVVFSSSGTPIASIAESDKVAGSGRVTAADTAGLGVFSAGWTPDTGGNACVIRNGRLWCVGVNIPLGIGANPGQ